MDTTFHIRPFSASDVEPLRILRNEVIRDTLFIYENGTWEMEQAEKWYAELVREGRIAITAEDSGQFLGCCYASFFRPVSASRGIAELSIYINQDHREKGIAQALIAAMENILLKNGYFGMVAVIDSENQPAIKLFESLLFLPIGVIERAALLRGNWRQARLMQKLI
jgi:L-amino acid N-acyltransferase YncA